ncbi:MAG: sulfotransferase family protein [Halieaceae bacterium]|nr:sulfotransferase family protein [Halieaceae bacterium]|tara:strand:+ start:2372 stop:4342 length:1971 start_codon:yes stop_codon:yes gene_type:complete
MSSLETLFAQASDALRHQDAERARDLCAEARQQAPDDLRFVMLHGFALRRSGDHAAAEPLLRRTLSVDPGLEIGHHELGLALQGLGRLGEARRALEQAVNLNPKLVAAWRDLYEVRAAEGDDVGAAEAYRNAMGNKELDPLLHKALELVGQGRLGVAEGICREYLKRRPHDVDAIRLLAEVGIAIGSIGEALLLLERCLELAPEFHVARANYVTALSRHQRFDEALAENERLRKAQPNNLAHQVQCATTLSMAGRFEPAHSEFAKVLEQAPDNERILTSYGHSLRYGGKGDEAIAVYLRAIEAEPSAGEAYWSLANLKTFRFDDAQLASMQSQLAALTRPSEDKTHLAFAVGKALEDREEYDASFAAYAEGNAIKRQMSGYDADKTSARIDRLIARCGADLWNKEGHPSDEPIFIIGLPRAGSTLLEQILASHSQVEATAELPFIGRIIGEMVADRERGDEPLYPRLLNELSVDERHARGQQYLDLAAGYRTTKARFIDKLPNNWEHVAFIKTILPNATIIDARRQPMAACFANFKQLFARGQEFTYSLEDIGRYYADYLRLMSHWHDVFPGGLLTVRYEEVVDDLDTQVKQLLSHANLGFEEACLRYYEKDRAVRTASSEQVRQPIYRDALQLWERYQSNLAPLESILRERGVPL